ncbi:MAG: hypothetical protein R3D63_05810 [Paracoccaceae bacterium]
MSAAPQFETVRIDRMQKPDRPRSPRKLAGMITAGAVALSLVLSTALSARADSRKDDLAKALIAALVIGAIVHETRKDKAPAPAPDPVHKKKKKHYDDRRGYRIPAVCALEFDGERRNVTVYPERCLKREGVTARLPVQCANEARIYGKWDRIYSERCLRDAGFRLPSDGRGY